MNLYLKYTKCYDCEKYTLIDNKDYYMVKNKLWKKYGVGKKLLCMNCFEKRLGRKLKKADILICPLTVETNLYTASILFNKNQNY